MVITLPVLSLFSGLGHPPATYFTSKKVHGMEKAQQYPNDGYKPSGTGPVFGVRPSARTVFHIEKVHDMEKVQY